MSETTLVGLLAGRAAGPRHIRRGSVCEDASATRVTGKWVILAVSDGVGSRWCAQSGATTAVHAAADHALRSLLEREDADAFAVLKAAFAAARDAIAVTAREEAREIDDYACTLLLALADGECVWSAHVGDGGLVARRGGRIELVSAPEDQEYANVVTPLTADDWESRLTLRRADDIDGLVLFTDGVQHVTRVGDAWEPHAPFFEFLLGYAGKRRVVLDEEDDALSRYLEGSVMARVSDDDKTLVIAAWDKRQSTKGVEAA